VTTRRDREVFVHILDWPDRVLSLPAWGEPIVGAHLLAGGAKVGVAQSTAAITLTLPAAPTPPDTVVVLETR
jgi:alpha-L-fucosidase